MLGTGHTVRKSKTSIVYKSFAYINDFTDFLQQKLKYFDKVKFPKKLNYFYSIVTIIILILILENIIDKSEFS